MFHAATAGIQATDSGCRTVTNGIRAKRMDSGFHRGDDQA